MPRISKRFVALLLGVSAWFVVSDGATRAAPTPQQIQQAQQQYQQQLQQMQQQAQQQQQQMMQYLQQMQQNRQQQAQQAQRAGQQAAQQLQRQIQQAQRQAQNQPKPQLVDVTTTYEFIVADEGLVRTMVLLSPELDDKGRPKKLDAGEKKKLKGDSDAERKFPGYKAGMDDLQAGDEVIVTLARHRAAKGAKKKDADGDEEPAPKMKPKGKAKEKDAEKDDEEKAKPKAKEKDADDEEKPKPKGKKKEEDGEDEAKEVKKIDQSMWRPVGKLMGTVSEADSAGSRRVVIRITQKQWVMPGQKAQAPAGGQAGGDNHISLDPASIQATLVVIAKRGTGEGAGTSGGNTGFGGFGK